MMINKYTGSLIALTLSAMVCLIGCDEEEVTPKVEAAEPVLPVNAKPHPFKVSVLEVGSNYAVIDWDAVLDEDGDLLHHSVYLEDVLIVEDLERDSICRFSDLEPQKLYTGKVVVTDAITAPVVVPFSFTTKKYFTTFSRLLNEYDGRGPGSVSLAKTADGGYVVVGGITFNHDGYGHFLAKTDSLGNEEWHTMVEEHEGVSPGVVRQISDGGFIVVSGYNLLRFDQTGALQWHINDVPFTGVIETSDHEFVTLLTGGGVSRYNQSGTLLWTKYYDQDVYTKGVYLTASGDGNIVILGTAGIYGGNDLTVTKIDEDGNVLWSQTYANGRSHDFPAEIQLTSDQGFIIGSNAIGPYDVNYSHILKIDSKGSLEWDREFLWDSFKTNCNAIAQTTDGSYVFAGRNGYSPAAALLVKLDTHGEVIWRKEYYPEDDLDFVWNFEDLEVTDDGGFALSGAKSAVWTFTGKEIGAWLFKTNGEGELQ